MIGDFIKKRRQQLGLDQDELGKRVDVHRNTISRWERGKDVPSKHHDAIAEALSVTVQELRYAMASRPNKRGGADVKAAGVVSSERLLVEWMTHIAADPKMRDLDYVFLILVGLPIFIDRGSWVVSVTIDAFVERTHTDRAQVEAHWPEMLASGYVERVGVGEWTLRLVFPAR